MQLKFIQCVDDACSSVLAHSTAQSRCLSLDQMRSEQDADRMSLAADFLSRNAGLSLSLEGLPEPEEARGRVSPLGGVLGYTRP